VKSVDWRARKPFDDNVDENANESSEMHVEGGRGAVVERKFENMRMEKNRFILP
jgi:hypothetical protein